MQVDYVRVYQRKDQTNVGCNPSRYPTTDYINNHMDAYSSECILFRPSCYTRYSHLLLDPNLTYWSDSKPGLGSGAGYPWPKNSLVRILLRLLAVRS